MSAEPTIVVLAGRCAEGVFQPGQYVKASPQMAAGTITAHADGTVSFVVETTEPNTDRETFTVTIKRGR